MKLDEKGLVSAVQHFNEAWNGNASVPEAMQSAILAYLDAVGGVIVPRDETEKLCAFLERDATWDKCGPAYYAMKRAIRAAQEQGNE